jgi:asparagine synthase (glutamine-hydrolysing)
MARENPLGPAFGYLHLRHAQSVEALDLETALAEAVAGPLLGAKKPAVFFSGGVDSAVLAVLAKRARPDVIAFTAGTPGSQDAGCAKKLSAEIGVRAVEVPVGDENLPGLFAEAREVTGERSFMKLELSAALLALCKAARREGCDVALSGSGAEELFLGYAAHSALRDSGADLDELRARELEGLYEKDLRRGEAVARHCGIEVALPFLHPAVVGQALSVPASANFLRGENKAVLRSAARRLGVPEPACARPKKAMQYGSGLHTLAVALRRSGAIMV